ncbi:hydroxysteroid 11-beta-dehydrogenase 1-like protein isoform X6 [Manis pentadactyla]|uniref:hydroxysteroid 11-beta-dehydrogenase 1-like protein isoform X6 n=1 Tax=Manis pentadactyla TaxID=143292 RepID=UPI00255C5C13|nr:hydroxysteroid 11-beta-dehydrogenase 1-like protein isoform X6 [Manis pentadactyla]
MTTSTQPPGSPRAADRGQCWCWGGAGISLRTPGLPPGAHCPHRGPPAEVQGGGVTPGRGLRTTYQLTGLSGPGGLDYLVLNHLGATPAGTRARSAQATRWLVQSPPLGELPELRATDFVSAAQPDGQQRFPGGGVLAARPRARVVFQPLLGSQVRAGRFLHLSAAGAGRTGRERGRHRVRPGASRSRLSGRGSPGCHKGQGGPWAQGGPGRDSWWCHSGPRSLLPTAPPPALPAPGVAATLKGLVHPPRAQRHGRCCCLSSGGWCSLIFPEGTSIQPSESRDTNPDTSEKVVIAQDRVNETEKESREKLPACGNHHTSGCGRATVCQAPCQGLGITSVSAILDDTIAASIFQMRKLRFEEVV